MSKDQGLTEPEEDLDTELASFDKVFIVECFLELLTYFHGFTHPNESTPSFPVC